MSTAKKQKTEHPPPVINPHKMQHYRFSSIKIPIFQSFPSGSLTGEFSVAISTTDIDPNSPRLLPFVNICFAEESDDPFISDSIYLDHGGSNMLSTRVSAVYEEMFFTFDGQGADAIEMVCQRSDVAEMVSNRGGYLELVSMAMTEFKDNDHLLEEHDFPAKIKLYCVIANQPMPTSAELADVTEWRKPDAISFWSLALGSHPRCGVGVFQMVLRNEGLLRIICSFLKFEADFASLEKLIEVWIGQSPNFCYDKPDFIKSLTASNLLHEYKRFLILKTRAEDWTSQILSPPMLRDLWTAERLIDEVWHLHIASPSYVEDIQLFTKGHQIQHHPVLRDVAEPRYELTRKLALEHIKETGEEKLNWQRMWPEIPVDISSDSEGMESDGCC